MNIGIIYKYLGKCNTGLKYYFKAYKIFKQLNYSKQEAQCLANIAICYRMSEKYDKALIYSKTALEKFILINSNEQTAITLANIGGIYYKTKSYNKALEHFFQSNEILKNLNNLSLTESNYNWISVCYDSLNDYKNAYKYYKICFTYHDSIYNIETRNKLSELLTQFGTERKEKS